MATLLRKADHLYSQSWNEEKSKHNSTVLKVSIIACGENQAMAKIIASLMYNGGDEVWDFVDEILGEEEGE